MSQHEENKNPPWFELVVHIQSGHNDMSDFLGIEVTLLEMEAGSDPTHKHLAWVLTREDPHGKVILEDLLCQSIQLVQFVHLSVIRSLTEVSVQMSASERILKLYREEILLQVS